MTDALAIGSEALALAEHVAHPLSLAFVLVFNAMLHVDRGEHARQTGPRWRKMSATFLEKLARTRRRWRKTDSNSWSRL